MPEAFVTRTQKMQEPMNGKEQTKKKETKISLTAQSKIDKVKKGIDKERQKTGNRPECPDAVARLVINNKLTDWQGISAIKANLDKLASGTGASAGYAFAALENVQLAKMFIEQPEKVISSFSAIAVLHTDYWHEQVFKSLQTDGLAKVFVKYPEKIVEIAQSDKRRTSAPYNPFELINEKIAGYLFKNPQVFVDIANATGGAAISAFGTLNNDNIAAVFMKNGEEAIKAFSKISRVGFSPLSNSKIADAFAKNPGRIADLFSDIYKATNNGDFYQNSAFYAPDLLQYDIFADAFLKDSKQLISTFSEFKNVPQPDAALDGYVHSDWFFRLLKIEVAANEFLNNPQQFVSNYSEIAKTGGDSLVQLLYLAETFAANPQILVGIAKAAGKKTAQAYEQLSNTNISYLARPIWEDDKKFAELFKSQPQLFLDVANATGIWTSNAYSVLHNDYVLAAFRQNPTQITGAFSDIAQYSGKDVARAFGALQNDKIGTLFANNPQTFVDIANAASDNTANIFEALQNDKAAKAFDKYCTSKITVEQFLAQVSKVK